MGKSLLSPHECASSEKGFFFVELRYDGGNHHRNTRRIHLLQLMRLVTLLAWLCLYCGADALSFTGEVIGILDGNTVDILRNGKEERIRLRGIDCPEKGQPFGNSARHATAALIYAKNVTIESHGKDKEGRTLADVVRTDGANINQELVKAGWCWWHRKYAPTDTTLEQLEMEAREGRKGLWADPEPIAPWEWRKRYQ